MNQFRKIEFVRTGAAIGLALLLAFILILFVSSSPMESIRLFLTGPLQSQRHIGNVIEAAIPLVFSGVAVSILFQTGLFNLGSEGVFFFSGLVATIVGIVIALPSGLHPAVAILAGMIFGSVVMLVIGVLKAKLGTSELVMSLMFNNILFGIGLFVINRYFRELDTVVFRTQDFAETASLAVIIPGTRIHAGILAAIAVVVFAHFFLYYTKCGYEIRTVGKNVHFARYSGISITKAILVSSVAAGAIAGMGGSIEVLGMYRSFVWAHLPGLGFDGALIAILANKKPKNVIFAALFLAYIRIGADMMARMTDVPSQMIGIMQGFIILLISGRQFMRFYKNRLLLKEAQTNG